MYMQNWKQEIFTVPNILSLFRLLLLPVYAGIYLCARELWQYVAAGGIMALSCITDVIDGQIARRFNMSSTLGKILDPLADKITQFTLSLCLAYRYPLLLRVLGLFVVKESYQVIMGIIYWRKGKMLPGALMMGKVCTAVLFISLITLVMFPGIPEQAVSAIAITDSVFLVISLLNYVYAYWGNQTGLQDIE